MGEKWSDCPLCGSTEICVQRQTAVDPEHGIRCLGCGVYFLFEVGINDDAMRIQWNSRPTPQSEGAVFKVSCSTCRKSKPAIDCEHSSCVNRGAFRSLGDDKPCEDWLPSKTDVRIRLQRAERAKLEGNKK